MKIIVNPRERYEIDLPDDEMPFEDFKSLVAKLDAVVRMIEKLASAKQTSQGWGAPRGREAIVEILKDTLTLKPNTPEMEEVLKKHDIKWATILQKRAKWVRMHNITPEEIGLAEFPWGRKIPKPL